MELLWTRYRELCIKIFISRTTTVYFCFKRQCYLVESQKTIINLFYCGQWLQCKLRRYVFNLILENILSPRYDWSKFLLGLPLPSVPTFEVSFLFVCFYGRRIKSMIYSPAILKSHYLCARQVFVPNLANSLIWLEVGNNSDFPQLLSIFLQFLE